MKHRVTLYDIKPFSINATYYGGSSSFIKTQEARQWSYNVFYQLDKEPNKSNLKLLREFFDPKLHYISATLTCYYPINIFFTKKDLISSKTVDCTNWEKGLVDCLLLPKNFIREVPYGCANMNVDDKYICDLTSKKRPHEFDNYLINIDLEIKELQLIHNQVD